MATRDWLDVDSNYENGANWTGGAIPGNGDVVRFLKGSQTISSGLDQAAVAPADVIIGPEYAGIIGSPTNPLIYGMAVNHIVYNGLNCQGCSIQAAAVTDVLILGTHSLPYSFYIPAGVVTNLFMKRGIGARIGAGVTVTNLRQSVDRDTPENEVALVIDAGATVTNAHLDGGKLLMRAAVTTLARIFRGEWIHDGVDKNIASLQIYGGAVNLLGQNCNIPTVEIIGGVLDASGSSSPKSIGGMSLTLWPRGTLNVNNGARTITVGTITAIGQGVVIAEPGRTMTIEAV